MRIALLNPQGNFDPLDSHWTEHPDFGGQLVYVKELGIAMADLGIDVDIVTRQIKDPEWPEFADQEDHFTTRQDRLRVLRIPCGGEAFLEKEKLWPHLGEWVDGLLHYYGRKPPDFFAGHYGDGGYACVLVKQRAGIGYTFTGHSLGAQKLDKLGMRPENADQFENRFHFSTRISAERLSMNEAFRVVTSTRQERMEQYGHPLYESAIDPAVARRFALIPPGVNTEIFGRRPLAGDEIIRERLRAQLGASDLPHVVVSSRLDDKKNILGTVAAFCESRELRAQARLALCVRGVDDPFTEIERMTPEEKQVMGPILQKIEESEARPLVDFLNLHSQEALAAAYRFLGQRGSVFVLSSFYEPFGLAPIEAAACGLAIVATRNGGPAEVFEDGSGILVDPADTVDIARGIREGLAMQTYFAELGWRRVISNYTWTSAAKKYLEVIREGVGKPQPMLGESVQLDAREWLTDYLKAR